VRGNAAVVDDPSAIPQAFEPYGLRYSCPERVEDMIDGSDAHRLYVLAMDQLVLFDELNFPADPRQVIDLRDRTFAARSLGS
jgi:hypothetical protein